MQARLPFISDTYIPNEYIINMAKMMSIKKY